jgi:RimJ/RimL family protein N-acetyltransferase
VCNVEKIIAPITGDNDKSIKLVKNMGFTEEARIKRSNGDMIFFTMLKDNCKFLGGKYD